MRGTQRMLFEFLRARERTRQAFTVDDAADASGLSLASIHTYLSKKLIGVWVTQNDDRFFSVDGLLGVSPLAFERYMSQKSATTFANVDEWTQQLRTLLRLGLQQGYPIKKTVEEIVTGLTRRA